MILKGLVVLLCAGLRVFGAVSDPSVMDQPNIVFVLADDLGVECLSSYGGHHNTPNLDRLASQGMRFTDCFSNPFCSPSRATLLTGRYPFKNGLTEVLWGMHQEDIYLGVDQPSFARQLKASGYATALSGKWHMSLLHKHNTVHAFGFDHYQSWRIFGDDGEKTFRFHKPYLERDGAVIADLVTDRYGPDVNIEFLIDFIESNARKKTPFLAYLTTYLPHFPWVPTPDSEDQNYQLPNSMHKGDPKYFPDMVAYLDKNVGRLMDTLEALGIEDDTVFVFLADNGTDRDLWNDWGVDDRRIQGGKGTMTDRGTHVPLIVRWPGRISPGSVCDDLIDFSDFFPTFCEIAGASLPPEGIHGRSFLPQLHGEPGRPREWVHVQHEADRHVRNREYILNNKNELRPTVEIWEDPATPDQNTYPEKEKAARESLQQVFADLGE